MEIILIRHGESIGNALRGDEAVFTGRWDCDLTPVGFQQAEALRNCSMLDNVDIYYCSPLKRAVQTANAFLNAELVIDERIQERSLGDFEGRKIVDIKSEPQYAKYFSDPFYMRFRKDFVAKAPNGESYGDVCRRVRPFVQELLEDNADKVGIISHFVVIKCIMKELLNLSEKETLALYVKNCDPIEYQKILMNELREYELSFSDMTREERHILHMWIRKGNSPYENGDYVCDYNCKPMDFVSTLRFWEEMQEYYDSLSEEEKLAFTGEETLSYEDIPDGTDESGFDIPDDLMEKVNAEVSF